MQWKGFLNLSSVEDIPIWHIYKHLKITICTQLLILSLEFPDNISSTLSTLSMTQEVRFQSHLQVCEILKAEVKQIHVYQDNHIYKSKAFCNKFRKPSALMNNFNSKNIGPRKTKQMGCFGVRTKKRICKISKWS